LGFGRAFGGSFLRPFCIGDCCCIGNAPAAALDLHAGALSLVGPLCLGRPLVCLEIAELAGPESEQARPLAIDLFGGRWLEATS